VFLLYPHQLNPIIHYDKFWIPILKEEKKSRLSFDVPRVNEQTRNNLTCQSSLKFTFGFETNLREAKQIKACSGGMDREVEEAVAAAQINEELQQST